MVTPEMKQNLENLAEFLSLLKTPECLEIALTLHAALKPLTLNNILDSSNSVFREDPDYKNKASQILRDYKNLGMVKYYVEMPTHDNLTTEAAYELTPVSRSIMDYIKEYF